jgi:broad specificity phosphatase PhoE
MLILVRHGRTEANAAGLLQGRMDNPLDAIGLAHARAIAKAIGSADLVISSPLVRAVQTAEALGLPVQTDDRWLELDYGTLDGLPVASVGADVWDRWRRDASYIPAGGESLQTLFDRVVAACTDLLTAAADADVVVVSHVSPIKAAMAWALAGGPESAWRSHLDPASITRIGITPRGPVLRSFNETAHLSGC